MEFTKRDKVFISLNDRSELIDISYFSERLTVGFWHEKTEEAVYIRDRIITKFGSIIPSELESEILVIFLTFLDFGDDLDDKIYKELKKRNVYNRHDELNKNYRYYT